MPIGWKLQVAGHVIFEHHEVDGKSQRRLWVHGVKEIAEGPLQ